MVDFYDRQGRPIDRDRWVELGEDDDYRRVAEDQAGVAYISTVWLGTDHSGGYGPPEIFESMVFGGARDQDCMRWCTEAGALAGHAQIVASIGGLIAPALQETHYAQQNPESAVLDAIDQLVNEQLEVGPVDDYSADRYVKCARCGNDWHGLELYGCPPSDLEGPIRPADGPKPTVYVDQVESVRVHDGSGWTLADIATIRGGFARAGPYAFQEHFAPACAHHTLDYRQGEIPTCHNCGEQVELRAGDVLEDDQIVEQLSSGRWTLRGDSNIRFWRANAVSGELEEVDSAGEPLWLHNLVQQTIRYCYEQLDAIVGINLNELAELGEIAEIEAARLDEPPLTPEQLEGPF